MEFYRPETEWIEHGENIVVYREPIDSTFHEPNVIVGRHPALRPKRPGLGLLFQRPVGGRAPGEKHPVFFRGASEDEAPADVQGFKFIFHTPKYRHCTHTTAGDTDMVAVWFGPFGDAIDETSGCRS